MMLLSALAGVAIGTAVTWSYLRHKRLRAERIEAFRRSPLNDDLYPYYPEPKIPRPAPAMVTSGGSRVTPTPPLMQPTGSTRRDDLDVDNMMLTNQMPMLTSSYSAITPTIDRSRLVIPDPDIKPESTPVASSTSDHGGSKSSYSNPSYDSGSSSSSSSYDSGSSSSSSSYDSSSSSSSSSSSFD